MVVTDHSMNHLMTGPSNNNSTDLQACKDALCVYPRDLRSRASHILARMAQYLCVGGKKQV